MVDLNGLNVVLTIMLYKKENIMLYQAFLKARLLDDISKTLLLSLIFKPKYWRFLFTSYRLKYFGKIKKITLKFYILNIKTKQKINNLRVQELKMN